MRWIGSVLMVGPVLMLAGCQVFFDEQKGFLGALPEYRQARARAASCPPCGPQVVPPTFAPTPPGAPTPRETVPGQPEQPRPDLPPQPEEAGAEEAFAQAPPAGTEAPASFSPNMFGDIFGASRAQVAITVPRVFSQNGTMGVGSTGFNGPLFYQATLQRDFGGNFANLIFPPGTDQVFRTSGSFQSVNQAFQNNPFAPIDLQRNSNLDTAVNNRYPNSTFNSANAVLVQPNPPDLNPDGPRNINPSTGEEPPFDVFRYTANYNQFLVFNVPSPSAGGLVGRTKISEDNNPLPRDRVIFNFDYFDNVPFTGPGSDVRRYSPGFEKTFFDRRASIEMRFPFASTLSSTMIGDGITPTNGEFGNIHITLKGLLYNDQTLAVASGMGISVPTADDVRVRLADGPEIVRIVNEAVILTPYIAALYTPNDRLFAQAWYQIGVATNGNPVYANPTLERMERAGNLNDQTLMQFDVQVGYWLIRPYSPGNVLRGLAPFIELHYNTTVNDADVVFANNFIIGDFAGRIDQLNLSTGIITQLGDNCNLTVGLAVPLRTGNDRDFDYQIGVRANYFFGPTARARSAMTQVSSF